MIKLLILLGEEEKENKSEIVANAQRKLALQYIILSSYSLIYSIYLLFPMDWISNPVSYFALMASHAVQEGGHG